MSFAVANKMPGPGLTARRPRSTIYFLKRFVRKPIVTGRKEVSRRDPSPSFEISTGTRSGSRFWSSAEVVTFSRMKYLLNSNRRSFLLEIVLYVLSVSCVLRVLYYVLRSIVLLYFVHVIYKYIIFCKCNLIIFILILIYIDINFIYNINILLCLIIFNWKNLITYIHIMIFIIVRIYLYFIIFTIIILIINFNL